MRRNYLCSVLLIFTFAETFHGTSSEPTWTTLRVTWSLNIFSSRAFARMPCIEAEAKSYGFSKLAGECSETFLGTRYIKGLDTSIVLLYDKNGFIAGMQSGIPESELNKVNTSFSFVDSPAYQVDRIGEEKIYFITTYFVDPSTICSSGRSQAQYDDQGPGTGLFLQNGTNPIEDSVSVPLYEKDISNTQWTKGGCYYTMGVHYWYNMKENFDCTKFYPVTTIYNRGKLTSFAFVSVGDYKFSSRFEHLSKSKFAKFLPDPVPKCFYDEYNRSGGFSTVHVYFSVRPWNIFC